MHMADALVSPAVAGTMYACSAVAIGYSIKKVRQEDEPKKIPLMGVMGAFVFAAQMINFKIPGTGASGHLCGGMMLSAVLGPEAGFLSMVGVLLVQCLLFADGGLLALGCNVWNMAFYGCFIGAMVIWRQMMKKGMSKRKIAAASVLGSVVTLQMGAFSVTLETLASGITELPFGLFISFMQPVHLAIGLVEGLITSAVLIFLYEARPELLWTYKSNGNQRRSAKVSYKGTVIILAASAAVMGGLLSLAASSAPDGLEWSIGKAAGSAEPQARGGFYLLAEKIQQATAVLPDYTWKNSDSLSGTAFSGIVGGIIVVGVCIIVCCLLKFFLKSRAGNE